MYLVATIYYKGPCEGPFTVIRIKTKNGVPVTHLQRQSSGIQAFVHTKSKPEQTNLAGVNSSETNHKMCYRETV